MLDFHPTQQDFEAEVPAFADSEQRIYGYLTGHIQRVLSEAEETYCLTDEAADDKLRTYVYNRAAYEAVPTLDLIATENGFAVVSNQNLAPASPARVQALRAELLRKADGALSRILHDLQRSDTWPASRYAQLHRTSLIWLPLYAERYGLAEPSSSHVSFADFERLRPHIDAASASVESLLGAEQLARLVSLQDTPDQTHVEMKAIELLRIYMATHVLCDLGRVHQRSVKQAHDRAFAYLDSNAAQHFELYADSTAYSANHFKPYENGPNDPCFFFG